MACLVEFGYGGRGVFRFVRMGSVEAVKFGRGSFSSVRVGRLSRVGF